MVWPGAVVAVEPPAVVDPLVVSLPVFEKLDTGVVPAWALATLPRRSEAATSNAPIRCHSRTTRSLRSIACAIAPREYVIRDLLPPNDFGLTFPPEIAVSGFEWVTAKLTRVQTESRSKV